VLADCLERIRASGRLAIFAQDDPDFPPEDVPAFMDANRFTFAIEGTPDSWRDITYVAARRVDVPIPARSV
jgi:hypothetical protein